MNADFSHIADLLHSTMARTQSGAVAEFGVLYGATFLPMARVAIDHGRKAYAVDSFQGMDEPTERDGGYYGKGALSVGGPEAFASLVAPLGGAVEIIQGFVPQVLPRMEGERFAFVHLDLDQYAPTLDSLRWLSTRMVPGGCVVCHDWFRGKDILASGAISDWVLETGKPLSGETVASHHCWFDF
jgi:O-methyltransferase